LKELNEGDCLTNIEMAIDKYITIEDYLDVFFEKDITTKYKKKKKGIRDIEFEELTIIEESEKKNEELEENNKDIDKEVFDIEPKKVKKIKKRPKLILEEAEEVAEIEAEPETKEEFIIPLKKQSRKQKINVNPPGKKGTRKVKKPVELEIIEDA